MKHYYFEALQLKCEDIWKLLTNASSSEKLSWNALNWQTSNKNKEQFNV